MRKAHQNRHDFCNYDAAKLDEQTLGENLRHVIQLSDHRLIRKSMTNITNLLIIFMAFAGNQNNILFIARLMALAMACSRSAIL